MGIRDLVNPTTVHYATQLLSWCAWTTVVAAAVRWTVRRDTLEHLVAHMDEISRREIMLLKDKVAQLEQEAIALKAHNADLRAWKRRVKHAVSKVEIGEE